jgi:hypothetical protein
MPLDTKWLPLLLLAGAALPAPGCTSCDQSGCDAASRPADDDGQSGIAGAVSSQSDLSNDGCVPCGFGSATLSIWASPGPISDSAGATALANRAPPDVTIQANGSYRQALDPGNYLICALPACTTAVVVAGHVTPVNVGFSMSGTAFVEFDPVTRARSAAASLEVTAPVLR